MTLDDAIRHAEEKAAEEERYYNQDGYTNYMQTHSKCAEENRQLAEWLSELKVLRMLLNKDIALIRKDTGEVILSLSGRSGDAIVYNDYELIDAPHLHDFVEIDGKIYVKTRCNINLDE